LLFLFFLALGLERFQFFQVALVTATQTAFLQMQVLEVPGVFLQDVGVQ
jgi:hypothetical protein